MYQLLFILTNPSPSLYHIWHSHASRYLRNYVLANNSIFFQGNPPCQQEARDCSTQQQVNKSSLGNNDICTMDPRQSEVTQLRTNPAFDPLYTTRLSLTDTILPHLSHHLSWTEPCHISRMSPDSPRLTFLLSLMDCITTFKSMFLLVSCSQRHSRNAVPCQPPLWLFPVLGCHLLIMLADYYNYYSTEPSTEVWRWLLKGLHHIPVPQTQTQEFPDITNIL